MRTYVAIAMPIYNESDGIAETLSVLDLALQENKIDSELFIQNDASTDQTLEKIEEVRPLLKMKISAETNQVNLGHGPTTWAAYKRAVTSSCSTVLQLDSDGQFNADQIPRIIEACLESRSVVIGVRQSRVDPWYRKAITKLLRVYLFSRFQLQCSDPNSPVRAYPTQTLKELLNQIPNNPLIPNIYLSVVASIQKIHITELPIDHRVRRGNESTGTMWSEKAIKPRLIPKRLIKFCINSYVELRLFGKHLKRQF